MISQFFVLSLRGDIIITREYRYDVPKTSTETFFRKVKFWGTEGEDAPPTFHADGVNYFHVKVIRCPSLCTRTLGSINTTSVSAVTTEAGRPLARLLRQDLHNVLKGMK